MRYTILAASMVLMLVYILGQADAPAQKTYLGYQNLEVGTKNNTGCGLNVEFYHIIKNDLSEQWFNISVQNLQGAARDINVSQIVEPLTYGVDKSSMAFYEWKNVSSIVPHYDSVVVPKTCWNETWQDNLTLISNVSYDCSYTKMQQNGTETIWGLEWKESKAQTFNTNANEFKESMGLINIPKLGSKEKDATVNGTKWFQVRIPTPITKIGNVWGSSGIYKMNIDGCGFYDATNSSWWNQTFGKCSQIDIPSTGNALTDYQIPINRTYDSDMQVDMRDRRYTNGTSCNDAGTELSYWDEQVVNSSWAKTWIKVPSIAASGNTTILEYYNASVASASNGFSTFDLYDDFNTASLNTTIWEELGTGSVTVGGGVACINATTGTSVYKRIQSRSAISGANRTFETNASMNPITRSEGLGWGNHTSGSGLVDIQGWNDQANYIWDSLASWGISSKAANTTYLNYSIIRNGTGNLYLIDNYNVSATDTNTSALPIKFYARDSGDKICVDWVRVRKYTSPEPTYVVNAEETGNAAPTITLSSPADASWSTSRTVSHQFTPSDDSGFSNCSVWSNNTGSFALMQANTSAITNGSANTISATYSADGDYLWGVQCFDNATTPLVGWSSTNRTIRIDSTAPQYSNVGKNATTITPAQSALLYSQWQDTKNLDTVWIETNESSAWQNYTTSAQRFYVTTDNQSRTSWNETFTGNQNKTFWIKVPKGENVTTATLNVSGSFVGGNYTAINLTRLVLNQNYVAEMAVESNGTNDLNFFLAIDGTYDTMYYLNQTDIFSSYAMTDPCLSTKGMTINATNSQITDIWTVDDYSGNKVCHLNGTGGLIETTAIGFSSVGIATNASNRAPEYFWVLTGTNVTLLNSTFGSISSVNVSNIDSSFTDIWVERNNNTPDYFLLVSGTTIYYTDSNFNLKYTYALSDYPSNYGTPNTASHAFADIMWDSSAQDAWYGAYNGEHTIAPWAVYNTSLNHMVYNSSKGGAISTSNPYIDSANSIGANEWSYAGDFNSSISSQQADLNTTLINTFRSTCTADSNGYCNVPVLLHSDTAGIIEISNIILSTTAQNDANFTWSNSSVQGTFGYRIYANDTQGNINATDIQTLTVDTTTTFNVNFTNQSVLTDNTPTFTFTPTDGDVSTLNCSLYVDSTYSTLNATTSNNTATNLTAGVLNDGSHTFYVSCADNVTSVTTSTATYSFTMDAITQARTTSISSYSGETSAWGYSAALTDNVTNLTSVLRVTATQGSANASTDTVNFNLTNLYFTNNDYTVTQALNASGTNMSYTLTNGNISFTTDSISVSGTYDISATVQNAVNYSKYSSGDGYLYYFKPNMSATGSFYARVALPASQQFNKNQYHMRYWVCTGTVSVVAGVPTCSSYSTGTDVTSTNEFNNAAGGVTVNMKPYDTDADNVMDEMVMRVTFSSDFLLQMYVISGGYSQTGSGSPPGGGGGGGDVPPTIPEIIEQFRQENLLQCPEGYVWDELGEFGEPGKCNLYVSPLALLERDVLALGNYTYMQGYAILNISNVPLEFTVGDKTLTLPITPIMLMFALFAGYFIYSSQKNKRLKAGLKAN